jgi:DNA-binding transcriptional ArsR family regulator
MSETEEARQAAAEAVVPQSEREGRNLDLDSLKALAHPLRVQIFDILSTYGEFTASGLAERLGESSGATSYHLRQLEKHGFVREIEGRGTGRERWWERTPGSVNIASHDATDTPAGRSAARMIWFELHRNQDRLLEDFVDRGVDVLPPEWKENAEVSTANTRLTAPQMAELLDAWQSLYQKYILKFKNQKAPGARPVQVHFNAFPVLDGDVSPDVAQGSDGTE